MTRYTKTDTASARACPNGVGTFIGWDSLDELSSEATRAEDLELPVDDEDAAIFRALASGQKREVGPFSYFRS